MEDMEGRDAGEDFLAAFEAAEAAQAAEALKHAEREAEEKRPAGGTAEGVRQRNPDEDAEETQWCDLFGDEGDAENAPAGAALGGDGGTQLTFASLFGEDLSDADDDVVAQNLAQMPTQEGPALSFEQLFGEHDDSAGPGGPDGAMEPYGPQPPQLTEIRIPQLPRLPEDQKAKLYYVRIPQALHFEERPYDPATLPAQLADTADQIVTPDNVIRWRHADEDQVQSNARIVQWDNGDMHLFVGREVYDISKHSLAQDHYHLFARGPDGTHALQHKLTTAMRFRTTLTKQSSARDLVSQKIKAAFLKKVRGRELRMGLSEPAGMQQREALRRTGQKRTRQAPSAETMVGVEDAPAEELAARERADRLHHIKRAQGPVAVRRTHPSSSAPRDDMGL